LQKLRPLNGECSREFYVKLIPVFQIKSKRHK